VLFKYELIKNCSKNYQTKPRRVKLKLENFVIPELLDRIFDKKVKFSGLIQYFFGLFCKAVKERRGTPKLVTAALQWFTVKQERECTRKASCCK